MSTLFDYFNLALSHSLDICVPSITLINRTYSKFSWYNIELVNLRKLLRRLQRTYASSKFESDLVSFKVFDRFTRKNFSLPNRHTLVIPTDMLGSYGISSKQAYKLSFTLVGKTETKNLPNQPDLVIC